MKRQRSTQSIMDIVAGSSKRTRSKSKGKSKAQLSLVQKNAFSTPKWGFPNRMYIAHRYVEQAVPVVSTTGSISQQTFRANGMFDPYVSGSGHQPMYFDNLTALYNHYTVVKSVCKATFTPLTASQGPIAVCLLQDDDSGVPTTLQACAESSKGSYKIIPAGCNEPIILYQNYSAAKTFGGNILANDNLQGTISADPVEQISFNCMTQALNLTSANVLVTFEITYYAIWDELKTQNEN